MKTTLFYGDAGINVPGDQGGFEDARADLERVTGGHFMRYESDPPREVWVLHGTPWPVRIEREPD